MKKRALILALAGIMAASLTGCGSLKDDAVVVKAGDEEITAGVANFYARYTQAQYETYFASYFGGDDMWTKNAFPLTNNFHFVFRIKRMRVMYFHNPPLLNQYQE